MRGDAGRPRRTARDRVVSFGEADARRPALIPGPFRDGTFSRRSFAILGLAALGVVVALRLLTLARDAWEWDELLFVSAARDGLDVRPNHPQPPGYPLFVIPARLLVLLGAPAFGATLAVAVGAGVVSVVLLAGLAREMGAGKEESLWAGLLWACVPSVWLHSVRPLSDSSGAAAFFLASLLLLRAEKEADGKWLLPAALAVGASAAVRPQVAVALLPLVLVVALRALRTPPGVRRAAWAAGAGLAAGLLPYVPVVVGSGGIHSYLAASKVAAEYVRNADSPSLRDLSTAGLWCRWLVDPFGGPVPAAAVWLAAAGVVASSRAVRLVAIAFLPLLLFSVATLNPTTAPRYALPFLAVGPLGASVGLTWLRERRTRTAAALAATLLAVVGLPAARPLAEVAVHSSPPVAAMTALRSEPGLAGRAVYLAPALGVHWFEVGPAVPFRSLEGGWPVIAPSGALVVTHDVDLPGFRPLRVCRFESEPLRRISRGRYLSVTVWESRAFPPRVGPAKMTDHNLLASVDEPPEGSVVQAPLRIRGWCQERGGELVVPVEFRVDGAGVLPEQLERTARPDVSATIPGIGDVSRAGYEASLAAGAVSPGKHVLEVVFESKDRRRVYSPRRFTVVEASPAGHGSSRE